LFLIARACKLAAEQFGWRIFYAYSDPMAGEIGTVYQAANWLHLGVGRGKASSGRWRSHPGSSAAMKAGGARWARGGHGRLLIALAKRKKVHWL
jgi:hypothetical protein